MPFYLRTGKRLARKLTEVAIHFKPTPHLMFRGVGSRPRHTDVLVFELQPDEGIVQTVAAKQPGPDLAMRTVTMNFRCAEAFGIDDPPRACAWLLLEVMQGARRSSPAQTGSTRRGRSSIRSWSAGHPNGRGTFPRIRQAPPVPRRPSTFTSIKIASRKRLRKRERRLRLLHGDCGAGRAGRCVWPNSGRSSWRVRGSPEW